MSHDAVPGLLFDNQPLAETNHDTPSDDDTTLDDGATDWASVVASSKTQPTDHDPAEPTPLPPRMTLELLISDPGVIGALHALKAGPARQAYANDALRIGVAALRDAASRLDTERLESAGERLLTQMKQRLDEYACSTQERTASVLKEYFDPQDGRFAERVRQLVSNDGELSALLREQLHGEASPLAKMLSTQLGRESPLMRQLDPEHASGVVARLQQMVERQLTTQREHVLREFSLDHEGSALRRLVTELTGKHGDLTKELGGRIDEVVKEFSLNEENSALSRLVRNVDSAQRKISSEFSLDNNESGLSRLKNELLTILGAQSEANAQFQERVTETLARLIQKRESAAASPEHGAVFEEAVFSFLLNDAQQRGDLCENTGATTGTVRSCKIGDALVTIGPDSPAAGARIVFEAKDARNYSVRSALEELDQARKNRAASFGVFIWARAAAPEGTRPLARYRNDLVVLWDAEDPTTDTYLLAAIEIARACVVEFHREQTDDSIDHEAIDRAINEIEKRAANLDKIRKPAETIRSSSETILERVRIDQQALERQVQVLREKLAALMA
ncbi:hypothetical protein [Botrimarina hoheduenensis]|uniref:Uncharacterized protein n=1 Tax=Botrimarina hoheduenensis TaxID=2528000 RepID=A0A5C5W874_9BACT|nr:hypothetical protein [Botrimarina hoheduenensis]TWT46920.1 hypothetical protein Pla111_20220 [Botrimarina hoheduenensis]